MRFAAFVILIVGMFLILHGVYQEKLEQLESKTRVEYRFIPRNYYEEQIFQSQFESKAAPLFEEDDQWFFRNIGREMQVDRKKI
jgi:hypothetical protein